METMPWVKGCLHGPDSSERLGETLWVNPLPTEYKLCPFNCLYCRFGESSKVVADVAPYVKDMPELDYLMAELNCRLDDGVEFDTLAISGNGEPTLYPDFKKMVALISNLKEERFPGKTFALLSNASGLIHGDVIASVSDFDLPIFKLDAGNPSTFHRVNQPAEEVVYEQIVDKLKEIGPRVHLQTVFVAGPRGNMNKTDIDSWMQVIGEVNPKTVEIYSINREFPGMGIEMVPFLVLEALAKKTKAKTDVPVVAFGKWE
jgi:wyosine [tRNA(Phe)-imidazoG37] synthetase (radical SAM superfamily)